MSPPRPEPWTIPESRWTLGLAVMLPAALAVGLTVTRLPYRWNQIALAYAAYYREYFFNLEIQGWTAAFTQFVGIHPPAYSLVFLGMTKAGASPDTWFATAGAFSVGGVVAVGLTAARSGMGVRLTAMAALLLAVSPHRLAYALEPNNYPLLLLVVALQGLAFADFVLARRRGVALAFLTLLGLWTHALFITVPLAQLGALAWSDRSALRRGTATVAVAALGCLPLVPGVLEGSGSVVNPAGGWSAVVEAMLVRFPARYGAAWAGWIVGFAALVGVVRAIPSGVDAVQEETVAARERTVTRSWALQVAVGGGLLALLLARGTAATHQFPYYLLLLPPCCLLAARSLSGLRWSVAVGAKLLLLASVLSSLTWAWTESARATEAWRTAAVTYPMVARGVDAWTEGSSLILLGYPEGGDDDKDVVDPAYALIPHHLPVNHEEPVVETLVGGDPYWGQPFGFFGDRWLYTYTGFMEDRFEGIWSATRGRGERVVVAIYPASAGSNDTQAAIAWGRRHGVEPLTHDNTVLMVFGPGPL
ncbi:MAG: hypothetical protein KDA24_27380 [Deltaproteobacteria bacterium]|nr:hypothetical protein [Deltaproteobacteria bacterium]